MVGNSLLPSDAARSPQLRHLMAQQTESDGSHLVCSRYSSGTGGRPALPKLLLNGRKRRPRPSSSALRRLLRFVGSLKCLQVVSLRACQGRSPRMSNFLIMTAFLPWIASVDGGSVLHFAEPSAEREARQLVQSRGPHEPEGAMAWQLHALHHTAHCTRSSVPRICTPPDPIRRKMLQREWGKEFKDKKKVVEWPGHCFESFVIIVSQAPACASLKL